MKRSNITWCDFSGGNANFVIRGKHDCECSPGCANCYAGALLERFDSGPEVTTFYPEKLDNLVRQSFREKGRPFRRGPGSRPLVFVCDMGDWLHPNIGDDLAREIVGRLALRCDVDWLLLTKRALRLGLLFPRVPPNIWMGVTVEAQGEAWRVVSLLGVDGAVRWASVEPLLGPIDLSRWLYSCPSCGRPRSDRTADACGYCEGRPNAVGLSWVVCGGESGPHRRPFDPAWALQLQAQCQAAGVPFFFKQGSALLPGQDYLLGGREYRGFPR